MPVTPLLIMGAPWWLPPLWLLVGALAQTSFFPALGLVAVKPDLVLVSVVIWAVLRGAREALPWGFTGGLILDLLSGAPIGTATLALVLVAYGSSVGELSLFRNTMVLPIVTVFWASVVYSLIFLFLLRTHEYPVDWLSTLRHVVVPSAILNTIVSPLVFAVLHRIERHTGGVIAGEV